MFLPLAANYPSPVEQLVGSGNPNLFQTKETNEQTHTNAAIQLHYHVSGT